MSRARSTLDAAWSYSFPSSMPRPLQLLLSLGLTYYALTRMPKVFDSMWERKACCPELCCAMLRDASADNLMRAGGVSSAASSSSASRP